MILNLSTATPTDVTTWDHETLDHDFVRAAWRIPEAVQLWMATRTSYARDLIARPKPLSDEVFAVLWASTAPFDLERGLLARRHLRGRACQTVLEASDLDAYRLEDFILANSSLSKEQVLTLGLERISPRAADQLRLRFRDDEQVTEYLRSVPEPMSFMSFSLRIGRIAWAAPAPATDPQCSLASVVSEPDLDYAPLVTERLGDNPERWSYWLSCLASINDGITLAQALDTTVALCELHKVPKHAVL